jgi:hypothetical protein
VSAKDAERELRRHAERETGTLWIDVRWLEALGRGRVAEIVSEYGFGPLRPSFPKRERLHRLDGCT